MKKSFNIFRSFRFKIMVVMVMLMVFAGALSNYVIYEYALKNQLEQLRSKLEVIAQAVALMVNTDTVLKIPLNENGLASPYYKATEEKLLEIKRIIPSIEYIYILEKTQKTGVLKFIIDVHPSNAAARKATAKPGEEYDGSRFPELLNAFNGPSADRQLVADEWGVFLSGYAPIRDSNGKTVAILGIDMSAKDVYNLQREVHRRAILILICSIALSLLFGILVSGRVTAPINELVKGTRHISSGNLDYRVSVKGADEIAELGQSFNQMAKRLAEAKQALVNYFYRVVQSLIRALEAKDAYTRGHSDRVADYSEKIARMMNLPQDKVELLKEAALLHDIGKLGIQEVVLNKKAMLTDDERKAIQEHPAIGEEILKPVSPDKEMLAVVRGHHERYDGKGYPDGLAGDKIDILAAIVAVADSYDAMTSHRAYRTDLSLNDALDQLKKNSGFQFNPAVVDAFIKVMKEK